MTISAVVPVWNGRDLLARLLATLRVQTVPASELLVVDNGSSDGAPELAQENGARVLSMGYNSGFARAVNRGIRESRGEWIAVLNSDVELAPDYFERLTNTDAKFATGKILMAASPERIDATFDAVCRGGCAARLGHGALDGPAFANRRPIFLAPWTAVVYRRRVFDQIGFLEESFESYLEDVEFGIRCGLRGVAGLYVPEAVAWHRGSAALGRWSAETVRLISRNQSYLMKRYGFSRYPWPVLVAQMLWGVIATRHGTGGAWLRGKIQALRAEPGVAAGKPVDPQALENLLLENEAAIREIQNISGMDWFWRMYFLLTRSGAK